MITYNDYPSLLFTSFDKETAPEELPFEVANEKALTFLSKSKGFNEMFGYIAAKNSLQKENTTTNYYFDNEIATKIDSDDYFRNRHFGDFFSNYVKAKHGTIMFKEGGQYVYLLLGHKETKALKKVNGRYICTAMFKTNFFIGFEEAIITEKGISVLPTGYYESGMDVGGFLSFVIITLEYASGFADLPIFQSNTIKEKIYCLR